MSKQTGPHEVDGSSLFAEVCHSETDAALGGTGRC